jgi:phage shock protein C
MKNKNIYKSDTNKVLAGICGGIGEYLEIDPTTVRIIFVFATIISFGSPIIFYIILMFLIPDNPHEVKSDEGKDKSSNGPVQRF